MDRVTFAEEHEERERKRRANKINSFLFITVAGVIMYVVHWVVDFQSNNDLLGWIYNLRGGVILFRFTITAIFIGVWYFLFSKIISPRIEDRK